MPSGSSMRLSRPTPRNTPVSTWPGSCSPTSASSTTSSKPRRRIRTAVAASNTSVTDLYGIGPIIACYLIGYTGDITRFANRDAYAAYNGTAPVEQSSGGRTVHRVSQAGTASSTHALHLVAISQIRNRGTEGRIYFDRKVAEGKTKKDAIRSLKRHASNAVYRNLLDDHRNREM